MTSGDLNSFVSEFNLNSEPPTNGFHELAQRVDLGPFDVAVFDPRNAVLAHLEPLGQLDLGKMGSLAKLTESISTNLIEHTFLVRINCLPVGRTFHQHILKHLSHLGKEEWAQDEEGIAEGLVETGVVRAHLREPLEAMAAFHERLMDETANVPPEEIAAFGDRHFGHIRQVVAEARESIDFLRRRMS